MGGENLAAYPCLALWGRKWETVSWGSPKSDYKQDELGEKGRVEVGGVKEEWRGVGREES